MKRPSPRLSEFMFKGFLVVSLLAAIQVANAALTHEYSFNDAISSTNAIDSVGGATGALYGGATYPGDGTVALDGSSGYVYLPNDIVSNYTSVTFEIWTTPTTEASWARLFDFGTSSGGPGTGSGTAGNTGTTWEYLAFADGSGFFHGDLDSSSGESIILGPSPTAGAYHDVVLTVNATNHTAALYDDGVMVSYDTNFTVTPQQVGHTYSDYIGRSQFGADPFYNGSVDEFRIYDNAYTPPQAEADYEAGANATSASPGNVTAIQFNNPTNAIIGAIVSPVILGTYSALTNEVNISTVSGIAYSSDNTNVIAFGADGNFHAVAAGTTTIRATYQSLNAALTVTVSLQPAVLLHRYSFNGAPGSTDITDSVASADGTLINGTTTAALTGSGQLVLDGNSSSAYVSLPPNLISTLTNATFQIWVNNQDAFSDWAELWTFGTNNGSVGENYLSLIPNNPPTHKLRLDNHQGTIDASEALPYTNEVCVTVTYNYSAQTASIYIGGQKVGSGTMNNPLYSIPDPDNYIGQSQYYGSGDPYLNAILDEFRIYSGVESDLQIAIDAAAGPDNIVTNPGALVSLTVQAPTANVDAHGLGVPVQVLANFANISGVDVSTLSQTTIASGNSSVGVVANGRFIPQNAGLSTVTATYGGLTNSLALTVVDTNAWPSLLHRWTFNEPPGSTTLTDSVGTINGTVYGPVTFTGQEMTTPAGNPPPVGGQPTTNSGWGSFPASQGVVSGLPNEASFEIWVVWNGGGVWQEIFDFGQAATPGVSSGGGQYVMICPDDGANNTLHAEWDQNPAYDVTILGPHPLQVGVLSQIVWTHDQDRQLDRLYLNGQLVGSSVNTALWSTLPDTDNWLARDEWPDPMFNGQYYDFRIWNGALTGGQVASLYSAGPKVVAGPRLQISPAGSQVTIAWPANATAFNLQSTTNLNGGTWTPVSGTTNIANGVTSMTQPTSQPQSFYRLKQ